MNPHIKRNSLSMSKIHFFSQCHMTCPTIHRSALTTGMLNLSRI